jgi:putative peptidoglycan lipid II flippase
MYLPIGLFGVSIATATLPAVSRQHHFDDQQAVRGTVANSLSLMLMLNVPAMVGLIVLAEPIVRVIFEHGEFTEVDTLATAAALRFYALGLLAYSVVRIVSPVFYALGRNRTPVVVSIVTVLINAGLNITLVRVLGYRGLALGTSIAALFNATVLLTLLRGHLGGLQEGRLASSFARVAAASAVMGMAASAADGALASVLPGGGVVLQIVRLASTIGIALVVLAVASWLLRIKEFTDAVSLVSNRLRRAAR